MNRIYGYVSLSDVKTEVINITPSYAVNKKYNVVLEKDDTNFITTVETEKTLAIMTGYFDQPLDESKIDLKELVHIYEDTSKIEENFLFGSFQVLFIDKLKNEFKIFCDRGGLRNWFVSEKNQILYFSTKIDVFNSIFNFKIEPNVDDRDFSLIFGYYPHNHTVYKDINKINGNKCLSINNNVVSSINFTSVKKVKEFNYKNENEIIDSLYQKFMKSIEKQVEGHHKVAVHLGGFDSALIASMLKSLGKEVETFTFYYESDNYEEFNQTHTDTLANYLGIKHNWVTISSDVYNDNFSYYKEVFDQPTNWPNYVIQTSYMNQVLKDKGFTITLSGDGCDTLFQGYPGVNRSAKFYNKASVYIKPFSRLLIGLLDSKLLEKNLGHIYRLIMRVIRNAKTDDPIRTFLMFRIFDESTLAHIFNTDRKLVERNLLSQINQIKDTIPSTLSLNKLAYMGRSNMGPNRLKLSGSMDSTGVSIFSPFMHNEVKAFVMNLPDELMRPKDSGNKMSDIGKYILTKMTQKFELLPDEIIFQKKQAPVNSPIDKWYEHDFQNMIDKVLKNDLSDFKVDEEFVHSMTKEKWVEEFYKSYISADKVTSHALSLLLTTLAFYQKKN